MDKMKMNEKTPYTKERVICETEGAMQNIGQLYQKPFINWKGKTRDDEPLYYTEIIAEVLLELDISQKLSLLPAIKREGYFVETHDGKIERQTHRKEEILAKKLFNYSRAGNSLGELGYVFDYQVPLKGIRDDKAGKIDLVSFNRNKGIIWLIELKRRDNRETLLRCALEVATYYQLLDKRTFIESYRDLPAGLETDCIQKAVLVFKCGSQHVEIKEMQEKKRPNLKKLIDSLNITIFLLKESDSEFAVEKVQL